MPVLRTVGSTYGDDSTFDWLARLHMSEVKSSMSLLVASPAFFFDFPCCF